jgi:cobalt/nickel transport system permease protein
MIAMHAPDGFLGPRVALATAVLSAVVLTTALRRASSELADRHIPLAGIAAAFVFAGQMVNFPVASGTTGHLLGGALAAILLGPWVGMVAVSVVILVQALLFADGGLTALGYNVWNMAVVTSFAGWALFWLFRRLLPANAGGVVAASGLAAGLSVVVSAAAFSIEWLFGASAPVPFDTVFGAMVGVHALIGIGEGLISAAVVGAVLAARPDLVAGARGLDAAQLADRSRISRRTFWIAGLLTALVFAVVVSQFAGDAPDGLERVATDQGFIDQAESHVFDSSVFADYATRGIGDERVSLAVAGASGVVVVLLVGAGMMVAVRRRVPERAMT